MNDKSGGQSTFSLKFNNVEFEEKFRLTYDNDIKRPLRYGIIISILSWFSAIGLVYFVIPEKLSWLGPLTVVFIGSYFGFIVYATYFKKFAGYYHILGAISNAWAGLYAIYFCHQFPTGVNLALPSLIFILFFGSYLVRLRWLAGFISALTYIIGYTVYIIVYSDLSTDEIIMYTFVSWMTLTFAVVAGRVAEKNVRISYVQKITIADQTIIIEKEKKLLLQEVHHRVQNNLQIILSLINLQVSFSESPIIESSLSEVRNRILYMSLIHKQVKSTVNFSEIALEPYTKALANDLRNHFDGSPTDFVINIQEDLSLDIDHSISFGLILNEIIENFYKHCKTDSATPKQFTIDLSLDEQQEIVLVYKDNGTGFTKEAMENHENSMGLVVMHSLADQLDAHFTFKNDQGAKYELSFAK